MRGRQADERMAGPADGRSPPLAAAPPVAARTQLGQRCLGIEGVMRGQALTIGVDCYQGQAAAMTREQTGRGWAGAAPVRRPIASVARQQQQQQLRRARHAKPPAPACLCCRRRRQARQNASSSLYNPGLQVVCSSCRRGQPSSSCCTCACFSRGSPRCTRRRSEGKLVASSTQASALRARGQEGHREAG